MREMSNRMAVAIVVLTVVTGCSSGGDKNGACAAAGDFFDQLSALEAGAPGTDRPSDEVVDGLNEAWDAFNSFAAGELDTAAVDEALSGLPSGTDELIAAGGRLRTQVEERFTSCEL